MKKHLCFAFTLLCAIATNAQQQFIATDLSVHRQWMDSLSKASISQQQQMIANRLLGDTTFVFSRGYCNTGFTKEMREKFAAEEKLSLKNKVPGIPTPLIFINGNPATSGVEADAKTYIALSHFIRITPFKKIESFSSVEATAIYGARAANGIILMELQNENDLKSFQLLYPDKVLTNYDLTALSENAPIIQQTESNTHYPGYR